LKKKKLVESKKFSQLFFFSFPSFPPPTRTFGCDAFCVCACRCRLRVRSSRTPCGTTCRSTSASCVWRMSRVPSGLSMRLSTTGEGRREARLRGKATRKKTHKAGKKGPAREHTACKTGGSRILETGTNVMALKLFSTKNIGGKD
jgi:hypothetical protein